MKNVVWFAVLSLFTISLFAQTSDDTRNKVLSALAQGDNVSAEKLVADKASTLTPTPAPAPTGNGGSAVPAGGSVVFEEIRSCGFYPQETRLACALDIKQPFGYGGPIGSFGSFEYVSFFVDWQGNGFQTSDYVGSGIVHITDGSGGTNFAVYRDFNPPGGPRTNNGGAVTTTTTNGPIYKALAKLSWFVPVTNPLAPQVWGNDFFFTIRLMPVR